MIAPLSVCMIVLAIGSAYRARYERYFAASQIAYAQRHGYKYVVVDEFLERDPTLRHSNARPMQRYLLGIQEWVRRECRMVVAVDADILMAAHSPPVHAAVNYGTKIGVVDEAHQLPKVKWQKVFKVGNPSDYYRRYNQSFMLETSSLLNTGLLIFQPQIHGEYLAMLYRDCVNDAVRHPDDPLQYEQACVGSRLLRDNMWARLPNEWNAVWFLHREAYRNGGPVEIDPWQEARPNFISFVREQYFTHLAASVEWDCIAFLPHALVPHNFVDPANSDARTIVRQVNAVNAFCPLPGHRTVATMLQALQ